MNSSIRHSFTLSLYVLVCYAATMLALAETGVSIASMLAFTYPEAMLGLFPAILTIPIAIAAYHLAEKRGWRTSTSVASILGLVAFGIALLELWMRDIEGRLLFGAHLLIYLSWILLWQEHSARRQWGLIALAILHMAVGSVLTTAIWYGFGLFCLVALIIWTLALQQIADAEDRYAPAAQSGREPIPKGTAALLAPGQSQPLGHAIVTHWPKQQVLLSALFTLLGSMAIGGIFFLLVPRLDFGLTTFEQGESGLGQQRVTGFSNRVRLGAFGQILESNAPAFHVRLIDEHGESIDVEQYAASFGMEEPLFRGAPLTYYRAGEWLSKERPPMVPLPRSIRNNAVRQEYQMRAANTGILFALPPVFAGMSDAKDQTIRFGVEDQVVHASDEAVKVRNLAYTLYSPADPQVPQNLRRFRVPIQRHDNPDFLRLPDNLSGLRKLADDVVGPGDLSAREKAERLLRHLRDSGEYHYSLAGELSDPSLDPIEDFLLKRKSGHCEYFASALALMLRSQGVPSRIVNGYKGGEVNRVIRRFEVQQRHAHSWVEARIDGEWVTLDPSPSSERDATVASHSPRIPLWSDLVNSGNSLWRDYIVQLNIARQRQALLPLRNSAIGLYTWLNEEWWPDVKSQVHAFATDPSRWFSWQGGLVTFIGLLLVTGLWWLGRKLRQRLQARRARRIQKRGRALIVDFYEEFRRICRAQGWDAEPSQTPLEFAANVSDSLRSLQVPATLERLPRELTYDYYHIRFGDLTLREDRQTQLRHQLATLQTCLTSANPAERPSDPPSPTAGQS